MRRCIALLLVAVVPVAGAGDPESIWVGDGEYFTDPVNWSGPPPDETVTCIFDIPDKLGPFVSFNEAGLSGRAIIRAGHPYSCCGKSIRKTGRSHTTTTSSIPTSTRHR